MRCDTKELERVFSVTKTCDETRSYSQLRCKHDLIRKIAESWSLVIARLVATHTSGWKRACHFIHFLARFILVTISVKNQQLCSLLILCQEATTGQKHLVLSVSAFVSSVFLSDISKLSAIKERLPDHVSYGHIKLVIAILELSCGASTFNIPAEPQSQRSFTSRAPPVKVPSKPASQDTARNLPGWLSGKPGGKRKNPF